MTEKKYKLKNEKYVGAVYPTSFTPKPKYSELILTRAKAEKLIMALQKALNSGDRQYVHIALLDKPRTIIVNACDAEKRQG